MSYIKFLNPFERLYCILVPRFLISLDFIKNKKLQNLFYYFFKQNNCLSYGNPKKIDKRTSILYLQTHPHTRKLSGQPKYSVSGVCVCMGVCMHVCVCECV